MLVASEVLPAVTVDGVPTSWQRILTIGNVTETVKEIVGLSKADAFSTNTVTVATGETVTLSGATTYTSGNTPLETYSREIERYRENPNSSLWNVRVIERTTTYTTS